MRNFTRFLFMPPLAALRPQVLGNQQRLNLLGAT